MSSARPSNVCAPVNNVRFKFHDLEITQEAVVLHFFDDRTVISLDDIVSYELKWYLHNPIFARKYWFLELTFRLKNGEEQSWPIAVLQFDYLNDAHQGREHIETKIAEALSLALSLSGTMRSRKK